MAACASTRCGCSPTPTSSARASASPTLPFEFTKFHFGYTRYFTPPVLVEAAPVNTGLFTGTTAATPGGTSPVLPERSHYFDAGVDQNIPFGCSKPAAKDCTDLDLGIDAYYKLATDLIDNGRFRPSAGPQRLQLRARRCPKALSSLPNFTGATFQAYANLAVGQEKATNVVSNQFLFDNVTPLADLGGLTRLQYVNSHWIFTDHTQLVTGSAGTMYQFCGRPAYANETFWVARTHPGAEPR